MDYIAWHNTYKEHTLFGRYITLKDVEPLLTQRDATIIGHSVQQRPIYQYLVGTGPIRVLMWSQMHGNESTTTKALFDLMNLLQGDDAFSQLLLERFSFCLLPLLNPDGAQAYTRENANGVDLNRDAAQRTQPESQLLRQAFETFQPHYCFNLHDQRTLFGAGDTGKVATVSFLAPSYNEAREIDQARLQSMEIIVAMNQELQQHIPGQVGRFDDSFNINCIGDTLQSLQVPTILFEAGHYPQDYYREYTRKMIFVAMCAGLNYMAENKIVNNKSQDYLNIPQNKINFYDFIYRNVKINYDGKEKITNFAAQYKEELLADKLEFNAYIAEVGDLTGFYGHSVFNAHKMQYTGNDLPKVGQKATFRIGNTSFVNGQKTKIS